MYNESCKIKTRMHKFIDLTGVLLLIIAILAIFSPLDSAGTSSDYSIQNEPVQNNTSINITKIIRNPIYNSSGGITDIWAKGENETPYMTDMAEVILNIRGEKISKPFDVVFAIDESGSMDWSDPGNIRWTVSEQFVDYMIRDNPLGTQDPSMGAVVKFSSNASLVQPSDHLSSNYTLIKQNIYGCSFAWCGNSTDFSIALRIAIDELLKYGNQNHSLNIIFLSDGEESYGWSQYEREVYRAKENGIKIWTVIFNTGNSTAITALQNMSTITGATSFTSVQQIYDEIYYGNLSIAGIIRDVLPSYIELVKIKSIHAPNLSATVNCTNYKLNGYTYIDYDFASLKAGEYFEIVYEIRALPPEGLGHNRVYYTARNSSTGEFLSRVTYINPVTNQTETKIISESSILRVHSHPKSFLSSDKNKVYIGESLTFFNYSGQDYSRSGFNYSEPDDNIIEYIWDFGDGQNKTTTNGTIAYSYIQAGNYTVTLRIKDEDNLISEPAITQIEVLEKPDLWLNITNISNVAPFEGTMIYINGTIYSSNLSSSKNVTVRLLVDNNTLSEQIVNVNNTAVNVSFKWLAIKGVHNLTLVVDALNIVDEKSEVNNQANVQISVKEKPVEVVIPGFEIVVIIFTVMIVLIYISRRKNK